ncbi:MAG: hypothetical protein JO117_07055, partial [Verrucomicrobia bacterium]|nr:hypothetical protein [Verrucomicrobiota bacterium]
MPELDAPAPPPVSTEENVAPDPAAATEEETGEMRGGLFLIGHPLVQVKLTRLRDATTAPPEFRRVLRELAALLFFSVTDDLPVTQGQVQTPLAGCVGYGLARPLVFAPVLRAGLGLLEGVQDLAP